MEKKRGKLTAKNVNYNIKGIKISHLNITMIAVTFITYIVLLVLMVKGYQKSVHLEDSIDRYVACQQAGGQFEKASDYLTEQARLFAETGNVAHMENYFEEADETKRRTHALETLADINADERIQDELSEAMRLSTDLMDIEYYSMRLAACVYGIEEDELPDKVKEAVITDEDAQLDKEQMEEKSRSILFDDVYQEYKTSIYQHVDSLSELALDKTEGRMLDDDKALSELLSGQRIAITVLFIVNLLMFILITLLVVRPLHRYIHNIREDERLKTTGSYELQYLAHTYNEIYEINAASREELQYSLEHDKLTGVMNREAFERLAKYLKKSRTPIAVWVVDVDKFKSVNDTYGHEVGDYVLKKVARVLRYGIRVNDHVVRYGGDEFVVLMNDIHLSDQQIIEDKVKEVNNILMHPGDGLPPVSISVGISFSEEGYTQDVFSKADQALYEMKESGRCGCRFAEASE